MVSFILLVPQLATELLKIPTSSPYLLAQDYRNLALPLMSMLNGFLTYWKKMISLFRDFLNMVSFKVSLKETESCALVLIRSLKSCLCVLWRGQIANQILTSVGLHILIIKLPVPRALSSHKLLSVSRPFHGLWRHLGSGANTAKITVNV